MRHDEPGAICRKLNQTRRPLPDALWKVFGDPTNQWMLGVILVGLVGTVAGPWAIVRFVSRQTRVGSRD